MQRHRLRLTQILRDNEGAAAAPELARQLWVLDEEEDRQFAGIARLVQTHPLWTSYLWRVRGVGPRCAAILIAEIDITHARGPASLWRHAGLDVLPTGEGRRAPRSWLKAHCIGVIGPQLLRHNPRYRQQYHAYLHRRALHATKNRSRQHLDAMAMRFTVKTFLRDVWRAWRKLVPSGPPTEISKDVSAPLERIAAPG